MSDYTNLDAEGLARLLSPSLIGRSARLLLEEKITQWACRQVVVAVAVAAVIVIV